MTWLLSVVAFRTFWLEQEGDAGVFNRRDYLIAGGEPLADLAETLLMEAVAETAP